MRLPRAGPGVRENLYYIRPPSTPRGSGSDPGSEDRERHCSLTCNDKHQPRLFATGLGLEAVECAFIPTWS